MITRQGKSWWDLGRAMWAGRAGTGLSLPLQQLLEGLCCSWLSAGKRREPAARLPSKPSCQKAQPAQQPA